MDESVCYLRRREAAIGTAPGGMKHLGLWEVKPRPALLFLAGQIFRHPDGRPFLQQPLDHIIDLVNPDAVHHFKRPDRPAKADLGPRSEHLRGHPAYHQPHRHHGDLLRGVVYRVHEAGDTVGVGSMVSLRRDL